MDYSIAATVPTAVDLVVTTAADHAATTAADQTASIAVVVPTDSLHVGEGAAVVPTDSFRAGEVAAARLAKLLLPANIRSDRIRYYCFAAHTPFCYPRATHVATVASRPRQ